MRRTVISLLFACVAAAFVSAAGRKAVVMQTTAGDIRIELYDETPAHRDNFLKLVRSHFYDSLLFHRVVRNFVVQAGDPDSKQAEPGRMLGAGTLPYRLPAEVRLPALYHKRGAVAMAREADEANPRRESDACQFYIVWGKRHSTAVVEAERERIDTLGGGAKMSDEMFETYRKVGGLPQHHPLRPPALRHHDNLCKGGRVTAARRPCGAVAAGMPVSTGLPPCHQGCRRAPGRSSMGQIQ